MVNRCIASLIVIGSACGEPLPPASLECEGVVSAGGGAGSLTDALESAGAGDCVLLGSETYRGSFDVPPEVTLASADGEDGRIVGASADRPAVTLNGGASLVLVRIDEAAGVGILVGVPRAQIADVRIARAAVAGIAISCTGASCLDAANLIDVRDTEVRESELGLWVGNARLHIEGGLVEQQTTTRLTGGYGVVATAGADLVIKGTTVADNHSVGVLIDGATTKAELDTIEVRGNQGRGVWVQRLTSTLAEPGVTMTNSLLAENKIAGLGVVASTGVLITGTEIRDTVLAPAVTDETGVVDVGDGLGVFKQSGDIRLNGVTLAENQRAQLLIDDGGTGIDVADIDVTATGTQEGAVIQNTTNAINDPMGSVSQIPIPIEVSAPEIPIPEVE